MLRLITLVALAIAVPVTAQQPRRIAEEPDPEEVIRNARSAIREARDAEAEQLAAEAWAIVRRKPADPKVLVLTTQVAGLYRDLDRWRDMEQVFEQGLTFAAADDRALLRIQLLTSLGWEYVDGDRPVKAMKIFERALDIIQREYGPKSTEAGIGLGLRFLAETMNGEFDKADVTLDEALSVNRNTVGVAPLFPVYDVASYDVLIQALTEISADAFTERHKPELAEAVLRRGASQVASAALKSQLTQKLISFLKESGREEEALRQQDELLRSLESSTSPEAVKSARELRALMTESARAKDAQPPAEKATRQESHVDDDPVNKAINVARAALTGKRYDDAAAAIKALLAVVPGRSKPGERFHALVRALELADQLADTPARDDRIVDQIAAMTDMNLARSPAIIRSLAEYYVKTAQSAKAYSLLNRWAEAVRSRAGSDAPELSNIFSYTADLKHREKDFRGALAVCNDWIDSEQAARGRWARKSADAYLKMAEASLDYEDPLSANTQVEAALKIAGHWSWLDDGEYKGRVKRASAIYRRLKDAAKADALEATIADKTK
jgi:hypothetical protein